MGFIFEHVAQEEGDPGAIGAPAFGDGAQFLAGRLGFEMVGQGYGAREAWFVEGEVVGFASAAQQDVFGGEDADAGKLLQRFKRFLLR